MQMQICLFSVLLTTDFHGTICVHDIKHGLIYSLNYQKRTIFLARKHLSSLYYSHVSMGGIFSCAYSWDAVL